MCLYQPIRSRLWRPHEFDEAARFQVGDVALSCLFCDTELHCDIARLQSSFLTELIKEPALSYIERLIYGGISLIYRDISLIYRDICGDISPIYRDICGDISPIYRDIYRFIYRLTDRDIAALTILAGCLWVWFKDHPQYRTQFLPRGGWIAAFLAGLRHAGSLCPTPPPGPTPAARAPHVAAQGFVGLAFGDGHAVSHHMVGGPDAVGRAKWQPRSQRPLLPAAAHPSPLPAPARNPGHSAP